jgi:hypothetical protein
MAHNNKTPASVLTAPISVTKLLVGTEVITNEEGKQIGERIINSLPVEYDVNHNTGEIHNKKRVARKLAAKAKRARRNKKGAHLAAQKRHRQNKDK